MASCLLILSTLTILSIAKAQDRAPHGLVYENPMAFSPSAVDFFHPKSKGEPETKKNSCGGASSCSPLPVAAQVATEAYESKVSSTSQKGHSGIGAGGIAGIVFGLALVALLAMGVHSEVTRRRNKAIQANFVQPDV